MLSRIHLKNKRDCSKDKRDASWFDSCVPADKILSPYLILSLFAQNVSFQSLRCGSGCFYIVAVEQIVFCNRKRCVCFEDFLHCWNNQKYLVITIKVFLYVRCVFWCLRAVFFIASVTCSWKMYQLNTVFFCFLCFIYQTLHFRVVRVSHSSSCESFVIIMSGNPVCTDMKVSDCSYSF